MTSEATFLDSREAITEEIRRLIDAQQDDAPILMLVAYWGQGVEELLQPPKTYKLVCNLSTGGTNPAVIEGLMQTLDHRVEIKHVPNLHAKVVMAAGGSVVSSSNLSTLGLNLGDGATGWIEAGVALSPSVPAYTDVNRWAWDLWRSAKDVTPELLRAAYDQYQRSGKGARPLEPGDHQTTAEESGVLDDFGLTENLLFGPLNKGNPKNPLRASSDELEDLYREYLGRKLSKRDTYITRYIAHLLWTHIGNTMPWRDGIFRRPVNVVAAWRRKGVKVKDETVREYLVWLSNAASAPRSAREACHHLLTTAWSEYVGAVSYED